ncbi:MAG: D-isomer specific 2-hydroxyacid dehydrogenase family protein [Micrococcales bacterium]
MTTFRVALEPSSLPEFDSAVRQAGAEPVRMAGDVKSLVWTVNGQVEKLEQILDSNPQLQWVQLPWAGIDAFSHLLDRPVTFTSAKGAYREPVAEHALMLCMAMGRKIPERVRAASWGEKFAVSLYDANVLIVGAGGITEELLRLLAPFRARVTVARRANAPLKDAARTVGISQLDDVLPEADFVILACALTEETRGLFDGARLARMKPSSYLINIARGGVVVTEDLLSALDSDVLAGAAIDVTDPEPLPDGHPAWGRSDLLITPHTADTPVQVTNLFAERIRENVERHFAGQGLVGLVDKKLGY